MAVNKEEAEVIVGTYEEFLLGYKLTKEKNKYSLSMSFTNHSQSKSIRAVSTIGKYIAAGSADESINLINMDERVEHGRLHEQSGMITCLTDFEGNYLFSGCEDGTICIWKRGSWLCEKTLKAHTGGVIDVSVHPSGKLALSIGKDKAMKTWNLVKGRCGYVTNLKVVADVVRWSPDGDFYAVSLSNRVDIYKVQTAKVVYTIPVGKRIACIAFINNSTIVIGGDHERVEIHDIPSSKKLTEFIAHKIRVKAIQYVPTLAMLFTASNDGFIKIWKVDQKKLSESPKLVTEMDTTCRITCMTVWVKVDSVNDENVEEEEEMEEMDLDEGSEEEEEVEDDDVEDDSDSDESDEDESSESEDDEEIAPPKKILNKKKSSITPLPTKRAKLVEQKKPKETAKSKKNQTKSKVKNQKISLNDSVKKSKQKTK